MARDALQLREAIIRLNDRLSVDYAFSTRLPQLGPWINGANWTLGYAEINRQYQLVVWKMEATHGTTIMPLVDAPVIVQVAVGHFMQDLMDLLSHLDVTMENFQHAVRTYEDARAVPE